jgi:hypothetical protein
MGVAPLPAMGRISSAPPGVHTGKTGLRGKFQFIVRKDMKITWPRFRP